MREFDVVPSALERPCLGLENHIGGEIDEGFHNDTKPSIASFRSMRRSLCH